MTDKRMCYFIPTDAHIPGHGFRVSIVTEDKAGHQPTGTWPYSGKPEFDVVDIIQSSMTKTRQRRDS
jgi:hypothetical protein